MPMKDLIIRFQPVQLYIVLTLSVVFFLVQLYFSHTTHSSTLLVHAYHMCCNILALSGCILTIKKSKKSAKENQRKSDAESKFQEASAKSSKEQIAQKQTQNENKLKNTFGWTRIDVLTMLIVCIFLASLIFSLLCATFGSLFHMDHKHEMHYPIPIVIIGATGIILNGLSYLLIGGFTYHQGSFFHITPKGDVVLDRVVSGDSIRKGDRRLSRTKKPINSIHETARRQGPMEMLRDMCSSIFVIVCAIMVYFVNDAEISKFIDPAFAIVSSVVLLSLSYPYMKEAGLILLQTIPETIDIEIFKTNLMKKFVEIKGVHDLHIWQLTRDKYVSTVHVIFQDPDVYARIMDDIVIFFHEQGITIVTIQPEFKITGNVEIQDCLVKCVEKACILKHCCNNSDTDLKMVKSCGGTKDHHGHGHSHSHKEEQLKPIETPLEITKSSQSLNISVIKKVEVTDEEEVPLNSLRKYASDTQVNIPEIRIISDIEPELNVEMEDDIDKVGTEESEEVVKYSDEKKVQINDKKSDDE